MKLTTLTLEQCQLVRQWRNEDFETNRTPYLLTEEMQADFYKNVCCNRNSPHRYWAIIKEAEEIPPLQSGDVLRGFPPLNNFVGYAGLTYIQWENRIAEIAMLIDPTLRGNGYGEQAFDLLLDAGFNQLGLNCIFGECYTANADRTAFWKKVTEKYRGTMTMLRARKFWGGKFWDSLYFDILKEEYERNKTQPTDGVVQSS